MLSCWGMKGTELKNREGINSIDRNFDSYVFLDEFNSIIYLIFVALIWGITNPFIRKGSAGLERIKAQSLCKQHIEELLFLITNLNYMVPYITSQFGSILYFQVLRYINISLAVPVSNSLTFIVTAITGQIMQEERLHKHAYLGMVLVLLGITICCWDVLN